MIYNNFQTATNDNTRFRKKIPVSTPDSQNQFLCCQSKEQCNICKKSNTKSIVIFFGVWVKLVALNVEGRYVIHGTTSTPKIGYHPPPPTIAHYNGTMSSPLHSTLQWHHIHSPKRKLSPLPPKHDTLKWHPAVTLAPYDNTQQ